MHAIHRSLLRRSRYNCLATIRELSSYRQVPWAGRYPRTAFEATGPAVIRSNAMSLAVRVVDGELVITCCSTQQEEVLASASRMRLERLVLLEHETGPEVPHPELTVV